MGTGTGTARSGSLSACLATAASFPALSVSWASIEPRESAKENGRMKSPCRVHEHARILRSVQLPVHSNPYSSRGAVKKKMTKAMYICRSAKKKSSHLLYFIFIFIFISYRFSLRAFLGVS
jgi:hypothetical protein